MCSCKSFQEYKLPLKRVSAGEFEGRLVPTLEIRGRSVSDPTVENTHLGTAARLDVFSGREAERRRIEKRKRGRRAEEETRPQEKREKWGKGLLSVPAVFHFFMYISGYCSASRL